MIRTALIFLTTFASAAIAGGTPAGETIPNQSGQYIKLLGAQKGLHEAEHRSANQRLQALEGLKAGGHASWLEVRRQKLTTDKLKARMQMYQQFFERAQIALNESDLELYRDRAWSQGQIHFTDMHIQMEGNARLDPEQALGMIRELEQELADHDNEVTRLASAAQSMQSIAVQNRASEARARLAVTQSRIAWLQELVASEGVKTTFEPVGKKEHGDADCTELKSAALAQCKAHQSIIEHMISMEQRRLDKVRELKAMAMASGEDVTLLENKISRLNALKERQEVICEFLDDAETQATAGAERSAVAQVRGEFQMCEAKLQLQTASLEKAFFGEVLGRLEQAAKAAAAKRSYAGPGSLSTTLKIGEQSEIRNYRERVELAKLKAELANRRLAVIQMQNQQGMSEVVVVPRNKEVNNLGLTLSSLSLTGLLTTSGSGKFALESMVSRKPIGSLPTLFRDFNSSYRPIRLTDSFRNFSFSYRPSSRSRGSALGSRSHVWNYQHGRGLISRHNYGSTSLYGFSSVRFGSGFYSNRGGLRGSTRAYQFGILDSRLRPFHPAGFPPWFFPGSPTNFRGSAFSWSW